MRAGFKVLFLSIIVSLLFGVSCGTGDVSDKSDNVSLGSDAGADSFSDAFFVKEVLEVSKDVSDSENDSSDVLEKECVSDDDCKAELFCTVGVCDNGKCKVSVLNGYCFIDGNCYKPGDVNPDNPCVECIPAVSETDWSADDTNICGNDNKCFKFKCVSGSCIKTPLLNCDDGNVCTDDSCDPETGCVHTPNNNPCDDGNVCTLSDYCENGVCVSGKKMMECDDKNVCTDDSCDPIAGCIHTPNNNPCDDLNVCTKGDVCKNGECVPGDVVINCDDGNPCTDEFCDPEKGCIYVDNNAPCDDGDPCTVGDFCSGKKCFPGKETLNCDDNNVCTKDYCEKGKGCVHEPVDGTCDDGNACTVNDFCNNGQCTGGAPLDCDDQNPCTEDSCDKETGCVHNNISGVACDDSLMCTVNDVCTNGICEGEPKNCDDGNDCTDDFCVEGQGCVHSVSPVESCELKLVITSPERGQTLNQANLTAGKIVVSGYVISPADPSPVVKINGVKVNFVPTPEDELDLFAMPPVNGISKKLYFSFSISPVQGMNLIVAEAEDKYGQHVRHVQSFYYSTVYYKADISNKPEGMIENGMVMALSQQFFDDNNTSTVDDLATFTTIFIKNTDFMSYITNPVSQFNKLGCYYDFNITNITYSTVNTDITIVSGGLKLVLQISNFKVFFQLKKTKGGFYCPGTHNGYAVANPAEVQTTIKLTLKNGSIVAETENTTVNLKNFDIELDSWFLELIAEIFEGYIKGKIEEAVVSTINDQLNPVINSLFEALKFNYTFNLSPLPGGVFPNTSLSMASEFSELSIYPNTAIKIGLKTGVFSAKKINYTPLGSIGWAKCLNGTFTKNTVNFNGYKRINMAIFDDLVNEMIYSAYYGGYFELELDKNSLPVDQFETYGITDPQISVSFMLPPILTACKSVSDQNFNDALGGNSEEIVIEIGDIKVVANFLMNLVPTSMTIYTSVRGVAAISVNSENEIEVTILSVPTVEVDITEISGGVEGSEETLTDLLTQVLIPMIFDEISKSGNFKFKIPEFDLSSVGGGLPANLVLKIKIEEFKRTDNANTVIKGSLIAK